VDEVDQATVRFGAQFLLVVAVPLQGISLDAEVGVHRKLLQQLATEQQWTEVLVEWTDLKVVPSKLELGDLEATHGAQILVPARFAQWEEEGVDHRVTLGFPGGQFARVLAAPGVDSDLVPDAVLICVERDNEAGNLTRGRRVVPEMNGLHKNVSCD